MFTNKDSIKHLKSNYVSFHQWRLLQVIKLIIGLSHFLQVQLASVLWLLDYFLLDVLFTVTRFADQSYPCNLLSITTDSI